MALIECPECGQKISDKTKLCVHCGVSVKICGECGKMVIADAMLCPSCGMEFEQVVTKSTEEKQQEIEEVELRDLAALKAKWAKHDEIKSKINVVGFILNFACILILAVILIAKIVMLVKRVEAGGSFNLWKEISSLVQFVWIWCSVDFLKESADKISGLIIEAQRSNDLKALNREQYLYFLRDKKIKTEDMGFYNQVETAAMPLEVPQERGKRTFSKIWALAIHIASFIYMLIFIHALAVNMYLTNSTGVGDFFGIIFGEMLGTTIVGFVILGCWISSLVIENKTEKRQKAWSDSLQNIQ